MTLTSRHAPSKAAEGGDQESRLRIGWSEIPSSVPGVQPGRRGVRDTTVRRGVRARHGGSRGIGRAIAYRFAKEGAARVAIGYLRNDRAAEETAAELEALGAEPILVRGNVSAPKVAAQIAELGRLDALVHKPHRRRGRPRDGVAFDWTMFATLALIALA
jgi:hypothetical protein